MNALPNITILNKPEPVRLPQGFGKTAPSVASAAMLVDLSISVWTARKKDKRASEQVVVDNNAKKGVARVTKDLLGDCAELDAVQKFAENVRTMHRSMSMPWSDLGLRLLPTAQFFRYKERMDVLEGDFRVLVKTFLDAYSWEIAQARVRLGDLFNPDEYPTLDQVREKFAFRVSFVPLPEAGDWRVDIDAKSKAALKTEYEAYFNTQLQSAMGDLWERLRDTLTTLVRQLEPAGEDGKAKRIYDSVVERAKDLVEMMATCNVTNDPDMAAMQVKLASALDGTNAEALRSDDKYKAEMKRKLDEAIAALPGLGW
jgi:hypothetical protein